MVYTNAQTDTFHIVRVFLSEDCIRTTTIQMFKHQQGIANRAVEEVAQARVDTKEEQRVAKNARARARHAKARTAVNEMVADGSPAPVVTRKQQIIHGIAQKVPRTTTPTPTDPPTATKPTKRTNSPSADKEVEPKKRKKGSSSAKKQSIHQEKAAESAMKSHDQGAADKPSTSKTPDKQSLGKPKSDPEKVLKKFAQFLKLFIEWNAEMEERSK